MQLTRFPNTVSGPRERLSGFMSHLRDNGLPITVSEYSQTLQALTHINVADIEEFRLACKTVCAARADHFDQFDELFTAYWRNAGRERQSVTGTDHRQKKSSPSVFQPGVDTTQQSDEKGTADEAADDPTGDGESAHSDDGKLVASRTSNIEKIDLRELMTPESVQRAEAVAVQLARAIARRTSRRRRAAKKGASIDLRRVIRESVSRGGEPLKLYKRHKPDRPINVVALLDVSGSMTVYARVFLSFLKGLVSHDQRTDAYLFHTALVRVSDALRDNDTFRAVNRLSLMAQGFGGGTKIGSNLQRFNDQYAAQSVSGNSVVVILSDGYDTEPPEKMSDALRRLKKRGCRIIWLNPLKGWKDYQPVTSGMVAAMPYLDLFAAANTLESLAALEPHLQRL